MVKLKLFIGGMATLDRKSAIQMMFTDEESMQYLPTFPKILYALGVPIIWFWGMLFDETLPEPELPAALNPSYFGISYIYTVEEVQEIINEIKESGTDGDSKKEE